MKTVYIPRGETVHYETLVTDHLVVKGYLDVTYGVKAKTISGSGVICAGSAEADSIRIDSLEAATAICKRLIAKRVAAAGGIRLGERGLSPASCPPPMWRRAG